MRLQYEKGFCYGPLKAVKTVLCTRQFQNCPCSPTPSQADPGAFDLFLKNFGQIPWYVGSWDGQMPHWLALPTTHQWLFKFFPHVKTFIQMKIS